MRKQGKGLYERGCVAGGVRTRKPFCYACARNLYFAFSFRPAITDKYLLYLPSCLVLHMFPESQSCRIVINDLARCELP